MNYKAIQISKTEYEARLELLRIYLSERSLTGIVLFDRDYILYYTGFAFIPTERPIVFAMNVSGERCLFVPRLEWEHAQANDVIQRVETYPEYPHTPHPMYRLKALLDDMGMNSKIGADQDGYPWVFGYRGPALSELIGRAPRHIAAFIEEQMMIKSPTELALIWESVKWGNLAHTLLQRYTRPGMTETEICQRASNEATLAMLDAIGPIYQTQDPFEEGVKAGYRGQIGRSAAIPHAMANNLTFQIGDVLVSGTGPSVWGYKSELERTMIIGPASDEQRRLFEHMLALQEIAFAAIKPGIPCAEVDRQVRQYYERHGLMDYWRHHVGHAIGLRYHEGPFLDIGDATEIRPGMVFTVEPGLYAPDLGGFRHSDTVVVTEDGIEILTYYPRDLDSLTLLV